MWITQNKRSALVSFSTGNLLSLPTERERKTRGRGLRTEEIHEQVKWNCSLWSSAVTQSWGFDWSTMTASSPFRTASESRPTRRSIQTAAPPESHFSPLASERSCLSLASLHLLHALRLCCLLSSALSFSSKTHSVPLQWFQGSRVKRGKRRSQNLRVFYTFVAF